MKLHAEIIKALSDPIRLRIMLLVLECGELCICDLMAALELPQSTVSRHVAYLKRNGWLTDRRGGVWMYYSLTSGMSPFHRSLAEVVRQECLALPEYRDDLRRLQSHREQKTGGCAP